MPGSRPVTCDDEFHRLNKLIGAAAKATAGLPGPETWRSLDGKTLNATCCRESLDALKEFSGNAHHLHAKRQVSRWYDGYHIVVWEVIRSYGDQTMPHITSNDRDR